MKTSLVGFLCLGTFFRAQACELPTLVDIPERVADRIVALRDVSAYSDAAREYSQCELADLDRAGGDAAPALHRAVLIARVRHVAAEHRAVLDLFEQRVGPAETLPLASYIDDQNQDCVTTSTVNDSAVVNDGAVIFFGRGDSRFLNVLEGRCEGLAADTQFVIGSIVDLDSPYASTRGIRVCDHQFVVPYGASRARRSAGCDLGRFYPITKEEADEILSSRVPLAESAGARSIR